tara:strand:+ start:1367 stop:2254 length:888 start_codon:yes stop_codon:yes gene_type:complete
MNQKYLNPKFISTIDNLHLKAKFIVEGFMTGLHKSPFHGYSVEFSEHKAYSQGDEIKNIDWKIWSKTDKYFVKSYEEETNLLCHILLDSSKSMSFNSDILSKFEYAKTLAAAISYLIINQRDSVGLQVFDSKIRQIIQPKSTKNHLNTILTVMNDIVPNNKTEIGKILNSTAEKIKKRGLVIILSDLFDEKESVIHSLKNLRYKNHDVILFHILDKKEIDLDYNDKIVFEDLENMKTVVTNPWQIKDEYESSIKKMINYYKRECTKLNVDYNLIRTNNNLESALHQFLNKRKRIL